MTWDFHGSRCSCCGDSSFPGREGSVKWSIKGCSFPPSTAEPDMKTCKMSHCGNNKWMHGENSASSFLRSVYSMGEIPVKLFLILFRNVGLCTPNVLSSSIFLKEPVSQVSLKALLGVNNTAWLQNCLAVWNNLVWVLHYPSTST